MSQEFRIDNIAPITYAGFYSIILDMRVANPTPEPWLPPFIDDIMVYYNIFNKNFLLFESDGIWNEETSSHPKLSLEARLDEREWFDRRTFV